MKRIKSLIWLLEKVFKNHGGVKTLHYNLSSCDQMKISHDPSTDVYTINGMKFTGAVFDFMQSEASIDKCFRLTFTDGETCTIEQMPELKDIKLFSGEN